MTHGIGVADGNNRVDEWALQQAEPFEKEELRLG